MTPIRFADYVEAYFKTQSTIKMTILKDADVLEKEYPLLHAVARCSLSGVGGLLFFFFLLDFLVFAVANPRFHLLTLLISSQTLPSCCQARVQVG